MIGISAALRRYQSFDLPQGEAARPFGDLAEALKR